MTYTVFFRLYKILSFQSQTCWIGGEDEEMGSQDETGDDRGHDIRLRLQLHYEEEETTYEWTVSWMERPPTTSQLTASVDG